MVGFFLALIFCYSILSSQVEDLAMVAGRDARLERGHRGGKPRCMKGEHPPYIAPSGDPCMGRLGTPFMGRLGTPFMGRSRDP